MVATGHLRTHSQPLDYAYGGYIDIEKIPPDFIFVHELLESSVRIHILSVQQHPLWSMRGTWALSRSQVPTWGSWRLVTWSTCFWVGLIRPGVKQLTFDLAGSCTCPQGSNMFRAGGARWRRKKIGSKCMAQQSSLKPYKHEYLLRPERIHPLLLLTAISLVFPCGGPEGEIMLVAS